MNLTYKKVENSARKNYYRVDIDFQHGDADATTKKVLTLNSEKELLEFLEGYEKFSDVLESCSSSGRKLPSDIRDLGESLDIIVYDVVYDGSGSLAYPSVQEIVFFDQDGLKHNVTYTK